MMQYNNINQIDYNDRGIKALSFVDSICHNVWMNQRNLRSKEEMVEVFSSEPLFFKKLKSIQANVRIIFINS